MKILVVNCGSSSLKYQLLDMADESLLAKGLCERIGIDGSVMKHEPFHPTNPGSGSAGAPGAARDTYKVEVPMPNHEEAVKLMMGALMHPEHGVIKDTKEIVAVGHRVVHGGEVFSASCVVTPEVKGAIADCAELAPLHNIPNLTGIEACEKQLPGIPNVVVFDTAFHQTMPEKAFLYATPYEYYEKYKVRRYGFHGTSHKFVSAKAAELVGKPLESLRIVSCHLGNGASVCAIKNGKVVDTSMGLTPHEGLAMGTRAGDIDAAAIPFLMEKEGLSPKETSDMLNKKSGVLAVSGVSSDFRDIEEAAVQGNHRAKVALELFAYRVAKYIGAYAAAMNGVDAIVFTAGLGENSKDARKDICAYLGYLGVEVDDARNNQRGKAVDFSTDGAKVRTLVVPTNEELVIARDTAALL